jgi:geranylgeranyl diphosphate synthase type I
MGERPAGVSCGSAAILRSMATSPTLEPAPKDAFWALEAVRGRVDESLRSFLAERRAEMASIDPAPADLVDELGRLIAAGGKRLRPAFCVWGHLACGGIDGGSVIRAAAALELLHTFALVHDDVMDDADERRGVLTTQALFALTAKDGVRRESLGRSVAVLVGDLGAVLAESMLRTSGFEAERVAVALDRFDRMRVEMAAGQYLDLAGVARRDVASAEHVAKLKGGSYTVEGPLMIGAALAGASVEMDSALAAFARPAGEAFQLRDDLTDRDAAPGISADRVNELVARAIAALEGAPLQREALQALRSLAELLRPEPS